MNNPVTDSVPNLISDLISDLVPNLILHDLLLHGFDCIRKTSDGGVFQSRVVPTVQLTIVGSTYSNGLLADEYRVSAKYNLGSVSYSIDKTYFELTEALRDAKSKVTHRYGVSAIVVAAANLVHFTSLGSIDDLLEALSIHGFIDSTIVRNVVNEMVDSKVILVQPDKLSLDGLRYRRSYYT